MRGFLLKRVGIAHERTAGWTTQSAVGQCGMTRRTEKKGRFYRTEDSAFRRIPTREQRSRLIRLFPRNLEETVRVFRSRRAAGDMRCG
jgi:hypothetical protein